MRAFPELREPARYTPWSKGVYEVTPSLRPFGTDFGNGESDRLVFPFDFEYPRYRANKLAALRRARHLHVAESALNPEVAEAVISFVWDRLPRETPSMFRARGNMLRFLPLEEFLTWSGGRQGVLHGQDGEDSSVDALDRLAQWLQDDLAIVSTQGQGSETKDWVSYLHVCAPSHWSPAEKAGLSFFTGHTVVPDFDKINAGAKGLVDAMVRKGPWTRFVWGLETDDRLNHHPLPPSGEDPIEWNGRLFYQEPFCVRVERQTIWPLPEVDAALFVIRVSIIPGHEILTDTALLAPLQSAVMGMSDAAKKYKGLDREWDGLLQQLRPPAPSPHPF